MTNREKYAEQILDIAVTGNSIAVDKKGKLHKCNELDCRDCIFSRVEYSEPSCKEKIKKWSEQEYVEPPVDWSKVPVDTKVYVRDSDSDPWEPRYFAKFEDGKIFVWTNGATSFSRNSVCGYSWWNQGKLAEDTV
jgi:hypothetical protein